MGMYEKKFGIFVRAKAGDTQACAAFLAMALRGVDEYWAGGGDLAITRCLGLPPNTARKQFRKFKRDLWFCRAAAHVTEELPWLRSVSLEKELRRFRAEIWPRWSSLEKPPQGTSQLRRCLFEAVRAYPEKIPESVRQLHNILSTPLGTVDTLFDAKARALIKRHARDDWAASTLLRDEFTSEDSFLAYRLAEAQGLITYAQRREEISCGNFTEPPA